MPSVDKLIDLAKLLASGYIPVSRNYIRLPRGFANVGGSADFIDDAYVLAGDPLRGEGVVLLVSTDYDSIGIFNVDASEDGDHVIEQLVEESFDRVYGEENDWIGIRGDFTNLVHYLLT